MTNAEKFAEAARRIEARETARHNFVQGTATEQDNALIDKYGLTPSFIAALSVNAAPMGPNLPIGRFIGRKLAQWQETRAQQKDRKELGLKPLGL